MKKPPLPPRRPPSPPWLPELDSEVETRARTYWFSQRGCVVLELRAMGHDIATVWTQGVTECGRKHRIVRYVFRKPRYERHWLELTTRYSRLGISMCMVLSQLWRLYLYISMLWAG